MDTFMCQIHPEDLAHLQQPDPTVWAEEVYPFDSEDEWLDIAAEMADF